MRRYDSQKGSLNVEGCGISAVAQALFKPIASTQQFLGEGNAPVLRHVRDVENVSVRFPVTRKIDDEDGRDADGV